MWPQRFGKTWSSMFMPATPMAISRSVIHAALTALPPPVSTSAMTGIETAWAMFQVRSRTSFICTRPTSGLPEQRGGEAEARHLDRLEARRFDDPGAERVVAARHDDRPPLDDGVPQNETLLHGISFQSLDHSNRREALAATASPISRHVEAPPMS